MKMKRVSKKISWVLAMGLAVTNPINLYGKELGLVQAKEKGNGNTTGETEIGMWTTQLSGPGMNQSSGNPETEETPQTGQETEESNDQETQETPGQETEPQTQPQTEPAAEQTEPVTEVKDSESEKTEEERKKRKPSQKEEEKQTETSDIQKPSQTETESESSQLPEKEGANSGQVFYKPVPIEEDFRFRKVEGRLAVAEMEISIFEEREEDSRKVGLMKEGSVCYILEETDGWFYVESGVVRGFVKAGMLLQGEEAQQKLEQSESFMNETLTVSELQDSQDFASYTVSVDNLGEEEESEKVLSAEPLIDPIDNEALDYTKTTTYDVAADRNYGIAAEDEVPVMGCKDPSEGILAGTLKKGDLCYILADESQDFLYIESGDVRGFVSSDQLLKGEAAAALVEERGENDFSLAEKSIEPKENPVLYYTLTSTREGEIASAIRTSMVKFAVEFVGNPYVWGGTSLTQGADCSGFVQSVYAQYGYSLPRVAADQAYCGTRIPVSEAQPGDLIFYEKNGEIYHVVLYIGDGRAVEAASTELGIITSQVSSSQAVWAVRIISNEDEQVIKQVNSRYSSGETAGPEDVGSYLGKFKLTSYCSCEICCGQWANGVTASGSDPAEGRTVAMAGVPFGTRLVIQDQIYVVEDRGTPYGHVDIYKNDHESCNQFGVQFADVYLAK